MDREQIFIYGAVILAVVVLSIPIWISSASQWKEITRFCQGKEGIYNLTSYQVNCSGQPTITADYFYEPAMSIGQWVKVIIPVVVITLVIAVSLAVYWGKEDKADGKEVHD